MENQGASRLSIREQQIVGRLSEGLSAKEIAAELGLTTTTIRTYLRSIYSKLHVHSALELLSALKFSGAVLTESDATASPSWGSIHRLFEAPGEAAIISALVRGATDGAPGRTALVIEPHDITRSKAFIGNRDIPGFFAEVSRHGWATSKVGLALQPGSSHSPTAPILGVVLNLGNGRRRILIVVGTGAGPFSASEIREVRVLTAIASYRLGLTEQTQAIHEALEARA